MKRQKNKSNKYLTAMRNFECFGLGNSFSCFIFGTICIITLVPISSWKSVAATAEEVVAESQNNCKSCSCNYDEFFLKIPSILQEYGNKENRKLRRNVRSLANAFNRTLNGPVNGVKVGETFAFAKGQKGEAGQNGRRGQKGERGQAISFVVKDGRYSIVKGDRGETGRRGKRGDRGPPGSPGLGFSGPKGEPGECEPFFLEKERTPTPSLGLPGQKGEQGDAGPAGLPGPPGPEGPPGENLRFPIPERGSKGDKGDRGADGLPGMSIVGEPGPPGPGLSFEIVYPLTYDTEEQMESSPGGTLGWLKESEKLYVRTKNGWREVNLGGYMRIKQSKQDKALNLKYGKRVTNRYNQYQS